MKNIKSFDEFLNENLNENKSNFKIGDKVKHVGKENYTQFSKPEAGAKGTRIYGEVELKDGDELIVASLPSKMGRIACSSKNFKGYIFTHDNEGKYDSGILPM
jgi:hypothetical protein